MPEKTTVNDKPGWTTIRSVSTTCGACGTYLSLGTSVYWRVRPQPPEPDPESRIIRTDVRCGPCADKAGLDRVVKP